MVRKHILKGGSEMLPGALMDVDKSLNDCDMYCIQPRLTNVCGC